LLSEQGALAYSDYLTPAEASTRGPEQGFSARISCSGISPV
jgi:hypothetical protein